MTIRTAKSMESTNVIENEVSPPIDSISPNAKSVSSGEHATVMVPLIGHVDEDSGGYGIRFGSHIVKTMPTGI